MKTISWGQFCDSHTTIQKDIPDYRLGQHFINLFIKDSMSDERFDRLWNLDDADSVRLIYEICLDYQWDFNNLVLLERR